MAFEERLHRHTLATVPGFALAVEQALHQGAVVILGGRFGGRGAIPLIVEVGKGA